MYFKNLVYLYFILHIANGVNRAIGHHTLVKKIVIHHFSSKVFKSSSFQYFLNNLINNLLLKSQFKKLSQYLYHK